MKVPKGWKRERKGEKSPKSKLDYTSMWEKLVDQHTKGEENM